MGGKGRSVLGVSSLGRDGSARWWSGETAVGSGGMLFVVFVYTLAIAKYSARRRAAVSDNLALVQTARALSSLCTGCSMSKAYLLERGCPSGMKGCATACLTSRRRGRVPGRCSCL